MRHTLYRDDTMGGFHMALSLAPPQPADGMTPLVAAATTGYRQLSHGEQAQLVWQEIAEPSSGGKDLVTAHVTKMIACGLVAGLVAGALAGRYIFPKRR